METLAAGIVTALEQAEALSGRTVRSVHLVGGGLQNELLCQTVADRSGRTVLAGPVEATAIGNGLVQGRTAGAMSGGLEVLRRLVVDTHAPRRFTPRAVRERIPR